MPVSAYTLKQAQAVVGDAVLRSDRRHQRWRALEHLFRTGTSEGAVTKGDVPGRLWDDLPGLTLDHINYALPHLSMILETVAARDPELNVEPYAGGDDAEQSARVAQVTLHYFWKRQQASMILRDMTQDVVVLGNGFCKVGWAHDEEDRDRAAVDVEEELVALLETDRLDATLAGREASGLDEIVDMVQLVESVVLRDEPFIEYVSPYDVLVPANARRMSETRWVAQRILLPVDEVRANTQFSAAALRDLQTLHSDAEGHLRPSDESEHAGGDVDGDDPFAFAELFEFYDMRARRLLVFQADATVPLYDGETPYTHRHPPFVHMTNFQDGGSRFWSFGDLENVASVQHQLNEYIEEQHDAARRAGNKYLIDELVVTDSVRDALESDESDVMVPIRLGNRQMADVVKAIERHGISSDVYAAKDDLRLAMQEVLGLNDFQLGGSGADRMSATAAAVVDGSATLRAGGKREQVERGAAHMGLLIILLCQEFLDEAREVRVAGPNGVVWLDVSRDDLRGEYGVSVEVGSTQAVNPSTRQQRALDLIVQIIPAAAAAGYDTNHLWRQAIRDYGYDPDMMLVRPEPDPAEQSGAPAGAEPPGMTVPQEALGGPPIPAAVAGGIAL